MRQSALCLFTAVGVLCILCSNCHSAEPKPPVSKVSGAGSESVNPAALRSLVGASFEATTTEHFVVLHAPGASYVAGACRTLEYAYGHFYEAFTRAGFDLARSKERLVWICFPQKSGFSEYALRVEGMDLSWLDGYYSTLTNRVAIVQRDAETRRYEEATAPSPGDVPVAVAANRSAREEVLPMPASGPWFDVTRLTHEVAHQLSFNSGIQKRGGMYPLWVSEGLATNFEFESGARIGLEHGNTARRNGLLEAYAAGELVPLRQFVAQTTVPPDAHQGRRHYAQAWGFFHFMLTERPENLRTYLQRLAKGRFDREGNILLTEFTAAFGPPETLELSWNAFLARQAHEASAGRCALSARAEAAPAQRP
jgi:hypothetical protein